MALHKVQIIASKVKKLSPAGQDLIKTVLSGKPEGVFKAMKNMQDVAGKSGMKISIGFQDGLEHREVVIADGRKGGEKSMSGIIPAVEERQIKNGATQLLEREEIIKNLVRSIDKTRDELKIKRQMYKDGFENNPTYREHDQKVREANKSRASVRQQIAKTPGNAKLNQEIKDLTRDLKEKKKDLSDFLVDYKERTGATQLELFDGQIMEIVQEAKLIRKR